jgi:hypothetical protein
MKKLLLLVLLVIEVLSCNELPLKVSDKTWSISAGLGTNRNFYFLGISKDLRINNNFSCFITTGIPVPSAFGAGGRNFFGTGMSFQNNYNNKGFNIAFNYGLQLINNRKYHIWHTVINYQWKIGKQLFLSSGLMGGVHYNPGGKECYFGNCILTTEKVGYSLPTISLDYRFQLFK